MVEYNITENNHFPQSPVDAKTDSSLIPPRVQTSQSSRRSKPKRTIFDLPLELRHIIYHYLIPTSPASERMPENNFASLITDNSGSEREPFSKTLSSLPFLIREEIYDLLYDEYPVDVSATYRSGLKFLHSGDWRHTADTALEISPNVTRVKNWILWIYTLHTYDSVQRTRKAVADFVNFARKRCRILYINMPDARFPSGWVDIDHDKDWQKCVESANGVLWKDLSWFHGRTPNENGVYKPDKKDPIPHPWRRGTIAPLVQARCGHERCGRDICVWIPASSSSRRDKSRMTHVAPVVSWDCSDAEFILRPLVVLRNLPKVKVALPHVLRSYKYPEVEQLALDIETLATSDMPDLEITSDWNNLKEQARLSLFCSGVIEIQDAGVRELDEHRPSCTRQVQMS